MEESSGARKMANFLKEKGWYLTDNGIKKLNEIVKSNTSENAVMRAALDCDLRDIAGGSIPSLKENIPGNVVLQVMKIRNVSAPKSNEDSKTAPKLLKIQFTDGIHLCSAVEVDNIPQLTINTPPGTKVYLKNGPVKVLHNMILLSSKNVDVLGGTVAPLVEKWEVNRSLAKYAKGGRMNLGSSGPPRFIAFGKEIPNTKMEEPFSSMVEAQPKYVADTENSEFNSQRTEAISEAIKTENKKVFGGGTKQLVDANVQKIMEKGYTEEQAKTALRYNKNNVDLALTNLRKRDERSKGANDRYDGSVSKTFTTSQIGSKTKTIGKNDKVDRGGETTKPSTKISLFDFVEDKLPQDNQEPGVVDINHAGSPTKKDIETRFENNISTSFANRNKRYNQNSYQSSGNYQQYDNGRMSISNRYNNREHGGRNNDMDPNRNSAGRDSYQNSRYDTKHEHYDRGHKVDNYRQKEYDSNQRQDYQDRGRKQEYQDRNRKQDYYERYNSNNHNNKYGNNYPNQGRDKGDRQNNYYETNNYQKYDQHSQQNQGRTVVQSERQKSKNEYQRRSSPHSKPTNKQNAVKNIAHITDATTSLNINSNSNSKPTGAQIMPHHPITSKPGALGASNNNSKTGNYHQSQNVVSATGAPVSHSYTSYHHVMGYQNKPTNDYPLNMMKPQHVPPQATATVVVPISTVPVIPTVQPNQQPTSFATYPPAAAATAVYQIPTFQINFKWNVGDVCLAKYWEDGRYYPAEITGLSESTNVVRFVDYANYEEVLKGDCLPLTATSVPPNAPQYTTRTGNASYKQSQPPVNAPAMQSHQVPTTNNQNRYRGVYIPPPAQRR